MIKAIEGHTIEGIDVQESAYYLTLAQVRPLLAMCHGTTQQATPSILYSGLSSVGRQTVMFSVFPIGTRDVAKGSDLARENRRRLSS